MHRARLSFATIIPALLLCSLAEAATIRGYVIDSHGHPAPGARVTAWHSVPTDQNPPQRTLLLGRTFADAHGYFTLSVDSRLTNMLTAKRDHESGAAAVSFSREVRIRLHAIRP